MRPEVNVTVIYKQCVTVCNPKKYPHTKFEISTSSYIGDVPKVKVKVTLKQYEALWHHSMYPHSKF